MFEHPRIRGEVFVRMPFDGDLQPHDSGWTIKVEPSPSISEQSRLWSPAQRLAYHEIAAGVAYHAVTAIQSNALRKRREALSLEQGVARYFFRQIRNEHNTICITIFAIHFDDPNDDHDPDGGAPAPRPLDPLVLNVSGAGNSYAIDYVEGVLPRPRHTNRIDQFILTYTARDVRTSTHDTIGSARYSLAESFRISDDLVSQNYLLRSHAIVEELFAKHAILRIRQLSYCDTISFIDRTGGADGTISGGIERLGQNPNKDAEITTEAIEATEAQCDFLLPSTASRNLPKLYTQQIYPSGLP
jgi:hypothetical protein